MEAQVGVASATALAANPAAEILRKARLVLSVDIFASQLDLDFAKQHNK
jgi:hypothetical protein